MEKYILTVVDSVITEITEPENKWEALKLVIPQNVTGINQEALVFITPDKIEVEEGNTSFFAKDGCLITKAGELIMVAEDFTVPNDGCVKSIGQAFAAPRDMGGKGFDDFMVPAGTESLGYRAFALQCDEKIRITVPASVRTLGSLSFMARSSAGPVELVFEGSPEIEGALFGTKTECEVFGNEFLKNMPEVIYTQKDDFSVSCKTGSSIEMYCSKYNIPCTCF